jgi:hypothetical protein
MLFENLTYGLINPGIDKQNFCLESAILKYTTEKNKNYPNCS